MQAHHTVPVVLERMESLSLLVLVQSTLSQKQQKQTSLKEGQLLPC